VDFPHISLPVSPGALTRVAACTLAPRGVSKRTDNA
jgi:hypothetical protein